MSLLSNYCENTELTATNTCVSSSKIDILNFKKLCFLLKKSSYFTTIIISQVLFIRLIVLPHVSVMPIFNVRQSANTPSVSLQMMPNGGEMVNTPEGTVQRGCGIPILGDFQDLDMFQI